MTGVAPGGHAGVGHDLFGEGLAALEPRGLGRRAEHEQAVFGEQVGDARHERRLGADHGQVDAFAPGKRQQSLEIGAVDVDRVGLLGDAGVAGRAEHPAGERRGAEGMNEGVLAATAADNQNAHAVSLRGK